MSDADEVKIELLLQLDKAEKAAREFEDRFVKDLKDAADRGEDAFKVFAGQSEEELRRLSQVAKAEFDKQAAAAKSAADKMQAVQERAAKESANAFKEKVGNVVGAVGDAKDAFEAFLGPMDLFSEKTEEAITHTADLASKGAQVGGAFGPWGQIIGGAAGAVWGLAEALTDVSTKADGTKRSLDEMKVAAQENLELYLTWGGILPEWVQNLNPARAAVEGMGQDLEVQEEWLGRVREATEALNVRIKENTVVLNEALEVNKLYNDVLEAGLRSKAAREAEGPSPTERLKLAKSALEAYNMVNKGVTDLSDAERDAWQQSKKDVKDAEAAVDSLYGKVTKTTKELKDLFKDKFDALTDSVIGSIGRDQAVDDEKSQTLKDAQNADMGPALSDEYREARLKEVDDFNREMRERLYDLTPPQQSPAEDFLDTLFDRLGLVSNRAQDAKDALKSIFVDIGPELSDFGQQMQDAFIGQALASVDAFFEGIATGEARSSKERAQARAAFFRDLGTQLVGDGLKNEFIGLGRTLMWDPSGPALMALGGAEIAAGLGMGGAGARAQRRQGYGQDQSQGSASGGSTAASTPSLGAGNKGQLGGQAPVIYQLFMGGQDGSTTIFAGDGPASTAKASREITSIQSQGARTGDGGFSRRKP